MNWVQDDSMRIGLPGHLAKTANTFHSTQPTFPGNENKKKTCIYTALKPTRFQQ